MLVAARVEMAQVVRQPEEQPQLLDTEVRFREQRVAAAGVGRFDQALQHVERGRLDAVAEQELLRAREFLHRGHEPQEEPVHRFQRWSGVAGGVFGHENFRFRRASRRGGKR